MIDYSEEWLILLIFKLRGSVMVRASYFAIPAAVCAFFLVTIDEYIPNFRKDYGFDDASKSQLWSATTGVLAILLGFRTNRAMSRFWEGTGLLHQMRGEWFDSVSCCVTFSRAAVEAKPREVRCFRHTLVRLMSLCHGSALEEIAGQASGGAITAIDSFGLDSATLRHLKECKEKHGFNRVEVLLHLTQSIITKALEDGVLKIPPPILSRVYQTLSRGFVNLLNAKKIADTRFPFPYAQIITMFLFAQVFLTPIMLSCLMDHKVMCPLFTFVPIFGMFYLNFVGVELENPFGDDDNDLPLDHFQSEMNNCLLMLLQENADLIATIDPKRCTIEFGILKESLGLPHDDGSMPPNSEINHRRISQFEWTYDPDALEREDTHDSGDDMFAARGSTSLTASMATEAGSRRADEIIESRQQLLVPPGPPSQEVKAASGQPMSVAIAATATQQRSGAQQLEASMFTGAIESFLEASHPMVLNKSEAASAQGALAKQELVDPLTEHPQLFPPPIFAPAPPYGDRGFDSPRQLDISEPIPDPTRAALPTIVPKTTRLQDLVPNRRDRTSTKGGVAAGTAEPKQFDQGVEQSMGEFKEALDNWTQLIEGQLTELRQNVVALRRFSDAIPELLEKGKQGCLQSDANGGRQFAARRLGSGGV